jgi:hypothetical protein
LAARSAGISSQLTFTFDVGPAIERNPLLLSHRPWLTHNDAGPGNLGGINPFALEPEKRRLPRPPLSGSKDVAWLSVSLSGSAGSFDKRNCGFGHIWVTIKCQRARKSRKDMPRKRKRPFVPTAWKILAGKYWFPLHVLSTGWFQTAINKTQDESPNTKHRKLQYSQDTG